MRYVHKINATIGEILIITEAQGHAGRKVTLIKGYVLVRRWEQGELSAYLKNIFSMRE